MKILNFIALTCLILSSCRPVRTVTVEHIRTDTTYITKHQRDSIWLHDSTHVLDRGDTLLIERWHVKYVERAVHDTVVAVTHDTVPAPYAVEVTRKVEKSLTWWQQARMAVGGLVLCGGCVWGLLSLLRRRLF